MTCPGGFSDPTPRVLHPVLGHLKPGQEGSSSRLSSLLAGDRRIKTISMVWDILIIKNFSNRVYFFFWLAQRGIRVLSTAPFSLELKWKDLTRVETHMLSWIALRQYLTGLYKSGFAAAWSRLRDWCPTSWLIIQSSEENIEMYNSVLMQWTA